MSRSRERRYYDDSDDMVERIRRAREAFEKKTKAFQGPDWPHYEKRIIVGQKKKEDMDPSLFQDSSTVASANTEAVSSSSSLQPNSAPENAHATTAEQTSSWWDAQREPQKTSGTDNTTDQSVTTANRSDDKGAS
jgi:phage-related tail fiber protein